MDNEKPDGHVPEPVTNAPIKTQNAEQEAGKLASDAFKKDSEKPMPQGLKVKKPGLHKRFAAWHRNLTKKQKILLLVVVLLLIGGACYLTYRILGNQEKPASQVQSVNKQPTTVQSKMTGLPVAPEVNEKQVTGVMIENSPDARPQSGLAQAGFVFEAVAEGGITRFLALYQDTSADYIGPVRSVRPYYVDVVASFDGAIAHVGGSPDALAKIKALNVKDLDQFSNPSAYERIKTRAAPHNVYTSSAKLETLEQQKGFTKSTYTGFEHAKKEEKAATVTAGVINLNLSGPYYNVKYNYEPTNNNYNRSEGGAAHTDEKSGKQLTPKVVIAVETTRAQNGIYSVYGMTGSGKVYVFQNGTVTEGTWTRPEEKSQYSFKDSAGNTIKLVPGQAWMTLVTPGSVSYAP